jgi:hypothetical protein
MQSADSRATLYKLPKSQALIAHAAAAIHTVTVQNNRLASIREAAVTGFDRIIEDDRLYLAILLKLYARTDFGGEDKIFIAFKNKTEMPLLRECKKRLETLSDEPVDQLQTITIALMRMSRPEFSRDGLIPAPTDWARFGKLRS